MKFDKFCASGNDFVILGDGPQGDIPSLARKVCARQYGIGADGLILLSNKSDNQFQFRIFNPDGSEAEMCGNGARCAVRCAYERHKIERLILQTVAGEVGGVYYPSTQEAAIKMTDPKDLRTSLNLMVLGNAWLVDYVDTGVPHAVVFCDSVDSVDVNEIGAAIRYHEAFKPRGANVNFVQELSDGVLKIRTYERGVEAETLSCGTGSVASAVLYALRKGIAGPAKVEVLARSLDKLEITSHIGGQPDKPCITDVWLKGRVIYTFSGETKDPLVER